MASDATRTPIGPDGRSLEEQPAWRRDFPIDVSEDNYVARRDFTKYLVLTSAAFVAGQAWIGLHNLMRRARGRPPVRRVAGLEEIPVGGALGFSYPENDDRCILLRPGEHALVAFSQKCTHLSCAVQPRMDLGKLQCPCHNGWFDAESGRPLSGPPRRPLARITLEVRQGAIYATGVEERT